MFERTYYTRMGKKKSALMKMRQEIQVSREEFREVANWVVGAEVDRHVIEVGTGSAIVIVMGCQGFHVLLLLLLLLLLLSNGAEVDLDTLLKWVAHLS